jgi:hypothetical protein
MVVVHASELLDNEPLDAMMLEHIEADPRCDEPSNEAVTRVFRELAMTWWWAERGGDEESES